MTNGWRLTPVDEGAIGPLLNCSTNYSYSSPLPSPTFFSFSPNVPLSRISPPSPFSPKINPPFPLWLILLLSLSYHFASLNSRGLSNRGTAAIPPFYPRLYSHPVRVLYSALCSAVSLCSACLEGCPTNPASLSAPFSSSSSPPYSSSHSSKACFRRLLRASHHRSAEAPFFAHKRFAHR